MQLHTVERYSDENWAVPFRSTKGLLFFVMPPVDTYAECLILADWFTRRTGLSRIAEPARISHLIPLLGKKEPPRLFGNEEVQMTVTDFIIIQAKKDRAQKGDRTNNQRPAVRTFHFDD